MNGSSLGLPHLFLPWPVNFTATWLNGLAQARAYSPENPSRSRSNLEQSTTLYDEIVQTQTCYNAAEGSQRLSIFTKVPDFVSLECKPVIEEAESRITVDYNNNILSYRILTSPVATDAPWKDVMTMYSHNTSDGNTSAVANYDNAYKILTTPAATDNPSDGNASVLVNYQVSDYESLSWRRNITTR